MADQGVSNERKRELEQMDPFQEAMVKGLNYVAENKKLLMMIFGAVVVAGVIFSITMYNFRQSEIKASQMAAKAGADYAESISKDQDPQKGYEAVKEQFEAIFDKYANTSAGRMARVSYAKICFDAKEYDKAYDLYNEALENIGNEAGMENFLLSALGNLAQLRNDPEKAKSYYLRIESGTSDLMKDEARFALALIYASENDLESSLKMYEKIVKENEGSLYRTIAEYRASGMQ